MTFGRNIQNTLEQSLFVCFLQRVSIAECCISYDRFCLTDRPTVCHTLVSYRNDSS